MNWSAVTAICAMLGLIVTVLGIVYLSGQISQKISGHDERLQSHGLHLGRHDAQLVDHEVRLAKSESWRDGYSAGMRAGSSNV